MGRAVAGWAVARRVGVVKRGERTGGWFGELCGAGVAVSRGSFFA